MPEKSSITIEGQKYDSVTGLPLGSSDQPAEPQRADAAPKQGHQTHAISLHSSPQRSITLHRKATKHPSRKIVHRQHATHVTDVSQHPNIHKFAPHPMGVHQPKKVMDIGRPPVLHPMVARAHAKSTAKEQSSVPRTQTASETKHEALKLAVANTKKSAPLRQRLLPRQRAVTIVSATLALVLFGAYLTYLNMPALSVRVAAAQSGINAGYPEYRPDGYSLTGPVTYTDGKVSMNFEANGGPQKFSITQSKSGWNNDAVLDNYVTPRAGTSYVPYTERGLTIYTYDNNAAWVNGGILYTIEGDAPLSSEQIRRIATSLL